MKSRCFAFFSLCCFVALMHSCAGGHAEGSANNVAEQVAAKQDELKFKDHKGRIVYDSHCVLCHGQDGKKQLAGAKDLNESTLTLAQKEEIVRDGKGMMTGFSGRLSQEEIESVSLYVHESMTGEQAE